MQPVSAWAATAPYDISKSTLLHETALGDYTFQFLASGTALWIKVTWPDGGAMGFRALFALGAVLESATLSSAGEREATFDVRCRLGHYTVAFVLPESDEAVFRYTTRFTAREDLFIPFAPHDVVPLPESGRVGDAKGTIHVTQEGTRSGHLYFSCTEPSQGSVFYFQNLTALSAYAQFTETSMGSTVGGSWPEMGFRLPAAIRKPLPARKEVVVSDAFVLLTTDIPKDASAACIGYMDHLASVYLLLPRPETTYNDWPELAARGLRHLKDNKGCWTQAEGKSYLNAYVCDYDTPPEVMVQLAVLVPLTEYCEWNGDKDPILDQLRDGISAFYEGSIGTIVRWLPSLRHRLDASEEQKQDRVMDSWYLHHPLMNLSRLAGRKDALARKLLDGSLDYVMRVAKHFRYDWPVFYKMDTLEVIKAETAPGQGGERDVPGAYAHLMLQAHDLTEDKRYFDEAANALKKLEGVGFDIFYQANNTAFSAATALRMYKATGNEKYLDLSYDCLACLFRNMQLWEGRYGHSRYYSRFFAIYPLSDAPYTAPYEELEVYAALTYYLREAADVALRPSVRLLIAEFVKYFVFRMPYYFPEKLPKEVLSEEVKTGEIDARLLVPLEDLRDGWEPSGQVGQEVYGSAGAGFGILPRQYYKCGDSGLMLYSDYPVSKFRQSADSATFELGGDPRLACSVRILGIGSGWDAGLTARPSGMEQEATEKGKGWKAFSCAGTTKWRMTWKKKAGK